MIYVEIVFRKTQPPDDLSIFPVFVPIALRFCQMGPSRLVRDMQHQHVAKRYVTLAFNPGRDPAQTPGGVLEPACGCRMPLPDNLSRKLAGSVLHINDDGRT